MAEMINKDAAVERISNTIWHLPNDMYPRFNSFDVIHAVIKDAIKGMPADERLDIIHCKDCIYYDPPHVENNGMRYEYVDLPKEAFDVLGTGLVTCEYGINVGGRCTRDYNAGYEDDKRVFVPSDNFCGRAKRGKENDG